jgi:hypothetical protein
MYAGKVRIRVVNSRGHLYAQEVVYEWDPHRKRGITKVLSTLGALRPRRRVVRPSLKPGEIKARILSQMRAADYHDRVPRWPTAGSVPDEPSTAGQRRLARAEGPSKRAGRTPSGRGGTITGSEGLREFDVRVLRFARSSSRPRAPEWLRLTSACRFGVTSAFQSRDWRPRAW